MALLVLYIIISLSIGMPIAYHMLPNKYQKYNIEFGFMLGIMIIMLETSYVSYIGISIMAFKWPFILQSIISFGYTIYLIFKRKISFSKENGIVAAITLTGGIVVLFPILFFNAYNSYGDAFTYISIADHLLNNGYFNHVETGLYKAVNSQMFLYQREGYRMGAQFLLSLFTAVSSTKYAFYCFMQTSAIGHMFTVISIYLFARIGFKLSSKSSIIASIIASLHVGIFVLMGYYGFLPQMFGVGGMVFMFFLLFKHDEWLEYKKLYIFLIVIGASSLVLSYSEIAPFVVLSYLIFFAIELIYKRFDFIYFKLLSYITIGIILIGNVSVYNLLRALRVQLKGVFGWHLSNTLAVYLENISSMSPIFIGWDLTSKYGYSFVLAIETIIFICLVIIGIEKIIRDKKYLQQLVAILIPFILLLVYFTFFTMNPHVKDSLGHTWNISKIVEYIAFIFILFAVTGIESSSNRNESSWRKWIISLWLIGFIVINLGMGYQQSHAITEEMRVFTGNRVDPISEYGKFADKYKDVNVPIYLAIDSKYQTHKQILAYFLKDKKVYSDWSDCFYIYWSIPEAERKYAIIDNTMILATNDSDKDRVANTKVKEVGDAVTSKFIEGVYLEERSGDNTWQWTNGNVLLKLDNLTGHDANIRVNFDLDITATSTKPEKLSIFNQSQLLYEVDIVPGILNNIDAKLDIPSGKSDIRFIYSGDAIKIGSDPRDLAFSISNYKLIVNK